MFRYYANQTVRINGVDDAVLQGGVTMTVQFPQLYQGTFDVRSFGVNTLNLQGQAMTGYTANVTARAGSVLNLRAGDSPDMHLKTDGAGTVVANVTIGGPRGAASDMTVGAHDDGSTYRVLTNGSLTFDRLAFIREAASVTLNDLNAPAGGMGGRVPELTIKGLDDLQRVSFSNNVLDLDFADPLAKDVSYGGLRIADADFWSAIQQTDGDLVIKPTATLLSSGGAGVPPTYQYARPTLGFGDSEVFKIAA